MAVAISGGCHSLLSPISFKSFLEFYVAVINTRFKTYSESSKAEKCIRRVYRVN